jgi:hypothetical protein
MEPPLPSRSKTLPGGSSRILLEPWLIGKCYLAHPDSLSHSTLPNHDAATALVQSFPRNDPNNAGMHLKKEDFVGRILSCPVVVMM